MRLAPEPARVLLPDWGRITVCDRGDGIAPEEQGSIFDAFKRASSERHYGGLGLGLYIVKEVVSAHGGTVRVDSKPGEGATFIVSLPLCSQKAPKTDAANVGGTVRSCRRR